MFLQAHALVSYTASLLNRDDAGLAKRIPFGNATRLRVSSQCQKRHWRDALQATLSDVDFGVRSRELFTREVLPRLIAAGVAQERAQVLLDAFIPNVIDGGVEEGGKLKQAILFSRVEMEYFVSLLKRYAQDSEAMADKDLKKWVEKTMKDEKDNIKAMLKASRDATSSMFGRFVTSDLLSRVDAPVHVAHAITVHAANTEMDYFTVVDDLNRDEGVGSAHANQTELGAGLFYVNVVVDVPTLVANLLGCDESAWREQESQLPKRLLRELLLAVTSQSVGAKLGSTAPYARAETVLLEVGSQQPRTLANAFLEALPTRGNIMAEATNRLGEYLTKVDGMYGATADTRSVASIHDVSAFEKASNQPLDSAIEQALSAVWAVRSAQ